MRNRAYRRKMKKKKDKQLRIIGELSRYNRFIGRANLTFFNGEWVEGNHIQYPKNSNKQRFYKKHSNRIVRKIDVPCKGNGYRRYFDYKWEMD